MAITRYDPRYTPWTRLGLFQNELGKLFDTGLPMGSEDNSVITSDWTPAVDIREEKDRFVLHADIPGVDPKDIEIHMEDGILTIRGERESEKKEERDGYKRIERAYGSFYRRFSMPDTADAEKINAKSSNGVLEVVIPKHEKVQPRKIAVEH